MADAIRRRSRIGLIAIAILFLGPLFAAFFAYQSGWQPGGQTAHGQLLSPARPLPSLPLVALNGTQQSADLLRGKWTLLYLGTDECVGLCQQTLYNMRQVWKSLGRRAKRVQGVYLVAGQEATPALQDFLEAEHGGLHVALTGAGSSDQWQDFFTLDGEDLATQTGHIYVLDPLGNWVLVYRPTDPPKGLLKDLKKLLKLSQIG